jgi:hypothetical protein
MMPMTSSNWVSNSKKAQAKWLSAKKGASVSSKQRREPPQRMFECEMNNETVMNDIKEYFYSMKQYLVRDWLCRTITSGRWKESERCE